MTARPPLVPDVPDPLPPGADLDGDHRWSQVLNRAQGAGRRGGLFLDRDGVVVEEVHYLHKPADVKLIDGAAQVVAEANRRGIPVILVTNQAGIGRGHYGWSDFIAVHDRINDDLAACGAWHERHPFPEVTAAWGNVTGRFCSSWQSRQSALPSRARSAGLAEVCGSWQERQVEL